VLNRPHRWRFWGRTKEQKRYSRRPATIFQLAMSSPLVRARVLDVEPSSSPSLVVQSPQVFFQPRCSIAASIRSAALFQRTSASILSAVLVTVQSPPVSVQPAALFNLRRCSFSCAVKKTQSTVVHVGAACSNSAPQTFFFFFFFLEGAVTTGEKQRSAPSKNPWGCAPTPRGSEDGHAAAAPSCCLAAVVVVVAVAPVVTPPWSRTQA
jgi:hypothetical protein